MVLLLIPVLEVIFALRGTRAQSATQPDGHVTVSEGAPLELRCKYSTSASPYLYWYLQYPNQGLQLLLRYFSGDPLVKGIKDFEAVFMKNETSFNLKKHSAHWSDSAVYFCAVRSNSSTGYALSFGKGTSLLVTPDIKNPDPAVYQLRSPKYSNTSVCLFTDFDSKINVSQEPSSTVFSSNSMALDMRAVGPKSNGALRWSASTDFLCENAFKETFYSSSGIPCDATLIEKSFETDMSLNIQNLSVIGLRILLLKVAGFNLLMTLRLWSS